MTGSIQKKSPYKKSKSNTLRLGFNFLGRFYNPLKKYFLANAPEKVISQVIRDLDFHSRVLVVGGGADNTLVELFTHQKCDHATHVDVSNVLSDLGEKRLSNQISMNQGRVAFKVAAFLDLEINQKFDLIIFPFYLDIFTDAEVLLNVEKAQTLLSDSGSLCIIDFASSGTLNGLQKIKIWALYILFYPFTGIRRKSVPNYNKLVQFQKMSLQEEGFFFNGLYQFKSYLKNTTS